MKRSLALRVGCSEPCLAFWICMYERGIGRLEAANPVRVGRHLMVWRVSLELVEAEAYPHPFFHQIPSQAAPPRVILPLPDP